MSIDVVAGRGHPFQSAMETKDLDAVSATPREDVAFHAPLRFEPFRGRARALVAMSLAVHAFASQPGFRYTHTFGRARPYGSGIRHKDEKNRSALGWVANPVEPDSCLDRLLQQGRRFRRFDAPEGRRVRRSRRDRRPRRPITPG
jgi:hypothetical protein